jgi:predicted nuclease of predicted toxin-antitoxin system
MDFLANENIPLSTIRLLTESGHDVVRVADLMPGASDRQVIEQAINANRIVLTFDRDYGELIYRHRTGNVPGVIYFRFTPVSPDEAGAILLGILEEPRITLAGRFTVIERDRIRQRLLSGKND